MKFLVDAVQDSLVTLQMPGTNYQNTFKLSPGGSLQAGQRTAGTILAPARKIDLVSRGGNYVEPLLGRPRRMQGYILSLDTARNQMLVHVGYNVLVQVPEGQKASEFPLGSRVAWDNLEIPVFQPGA